MAKKPGAGGILAVAVVLGVATGIAIWVWMKKVGEAGEKNWDQIVVATTDIGSRAKIAQGMVGLASYPKKLIPENAIRKLEDVEGRITLRQINAKDPIRASDLVQAGQIPGLAYDIPAGMRAIAIGAGEVMAVGTSVKPGDRVDILATYTDPRTRQELTKMLLQNVKILAVNKGQTDQNGKEGANSSMTLAVKPEQTELVAAADRAGALRVSLRGVNDQVIIPTEGVSPRDFTGPSIPADAVVVTNEVNQTPVYIMPPAAQHPKEIQIIRGQQQQSISP